VVDLEDYALDSSFRTINMYEPYIDNLPFWEGLSELGILHVPNVIIRGDLHFPCGFDKFGGGIPGEICWKVSSHIGLCLIS
jgi:hypothetical protein